MLSVGSRDGRKGLGLGFSVGGEMEETELEEGEASYFHDDDASIDPDVSLSYIDEKLQDVLGHFQKDFEGGVSAENLGAKFGGYGSFLPTYQRSPSIWSHPRTLPKVQNNTPRSPNNLSMESSTVPSSAPLCVSVGPASSSAAPPPVSKAPLLDNSVKRDVCFYSALGTGEFSPKHEPLNKSIATNNHRTLKVRIKVGPDNFLARKNAEIYSGLGLDMSPSSPLEDSPAEIGEMTPESQDSPDESPTSILQIMTSFPVSGGLLLSPLPDGLIHLTEKEKLLRDSRSGPARKGSQEISGMLVDDDPFSVKGDSKMLGEKKTKLVEKSGRSVDVKNGSGKDAGNDISALLKQEIDIETLAGRELVSNALNLPLLSSSKCTAGGTTKGAVRAPDIPREANKGAVEDKIFFSDLAKVEALESVFSQDVNRVEKQNAKVSPTDKVLEDKRESSLKDVSLDHRKDRSKGNKSYDICRADSDVSKGRRDLNGGLIDPPKQVNQKAISHEQDGVKRPHGKEHPSSGDRRKSRGSQSNGTPAAEFSKESLMVDSSAALKDKKKSSHAGEYLSKSNPDNIKSHKESGKARESYRDLIGDSKMEGAENRMDSLETPFKDRHKDSKLDILDKETHTISEKSKERSSGKKFDDVLTSKAYSKVASVIAPSMENGPVSDAAPATVASEVIKENWVGCDRCQKWRLLPFGTEPKDLPEKWLCSMLNWLPGMNRCDVSEEETTKALSALYRVPITEGQNNMHNQPAGAASRVTLVEVRHLENHYDHSLHPVPGSVKKKHEVKEASNAANHAGSIHFSSSTKKNQQAFVKGRSLNDVNQSPLESNAVNKPGVQYLSKSGNLAVDNHMHKQKEKHKLHKHHSDEGVAKHSKTKSKREANQNGSRSSKKIKTEDVCYTNENWNSDIGVATRSVGPFLSSGLPTKEPRKDLHDEHFSSKDLKSDAKDSFPVSIKKPKDQVQLSLDGGPLDMGKCNKMDIAANKRKVKEWQETQVHLDLTNGNNFHYSWGSINEETDESERRKEKKARVSKSEGKETRTSKDDGRTDKKGKVARILLSGNRDQPVDGMEEGVSYIEKNQQLGKYRCGNTMSQRTLDGVDSLKRDLGFGQPSMAATSSSSKVSGSRKSQANFQEVKGSPVESVSSSPMRILNPDKLTSARRNTCGKDDTTNDIMNFDVTVMGSPRRFSDGEGDGGNDWSGLLRKEKTFSVIHCGSLESPVLDYQDKDADHTLGGKGKVQVEPSSEFENIHLVKGGADALDCHNRTKDHGYDEERVNNSHCRANGSLHQKSGKGSSSRSKDKHRSSKSDIGKGKIKVSDSCTEQETLYPMKCSRYEPEIESRDHSPYHEETRDRKHSFQEKCGVKSDKDENIYSSKKDSVGKWSIESYRRENQSRFGGHEGSGVKLGANCSKDGKSIPQQNLLQECEGERSSNRFLSDRIDKMDITSDKGKSQLFSHSGYKQGTQVRCPRPTSGAHMGSGSDVSPVDASNGSVASKAPNHTRKPDNQNGANHGNLRHPTSNGHGLRNLNDQSPVRRDPSSQAAANNALKEATDLKHSADRLKNPGSDLERTGLYFQAALKFLHAASLLEPCSNESTRSMSVYHDTARLCEFCGRAYERCKEMAAAALAYKCMEVAHMKVIYSKHSSATKDRLELKNALKVVPPGESPSSSASDIDNLNNQATLDKVAITKDGSLQDAGNHVIVAHNRPTFERLLVFVHDVTSAMEASRKSQNAFAAVNASLEEAQYGEGISSVKQVLDFSIHDVGGLLRLVRLAMEVISC